MFDDILLFIKVVEWGSFNTTAKQLGVAQSTISRKVDNLETELGTKLFKRDTRHIELTEKGKMLYENFKDSEEYLLNKISPLFNRTKTAHGRLNVALPVLFGNYAISPFIIELAHHHPDMELMVHYSNHEINMIKENYDLAIIPYQPSQLTQKVKLVHVSKIVIVCSAKYIEKHGLLDNVEQIDKHVIIGKVATNNTLPKIVRLFSEESNEYLLIPNQFQLHVSSFFEAKVMVENGLAIAGYPEEAIKSKLLSGELVRIMPQYHLGYVPYYLLRNIANTDPRYIAFEAFLNQCLARLSGSANTLNQNQVYDMR